MLLYLNISSLFFLQVMGGNLLPEAVTWFLTSVLRGLQIHGQHEVCYIALSQLAMLIYENLVRINANILLQWQQFFGGYTVKTIKTLLFFFFFL